MEVQVYDGDGIPPELPEWPKTVRAAAEKFLRNISKEDYAFLWKQALEDEKPENGMGAFQAVILMKRAIRNNFALWPRADGRQNNSLLNSAGHRHPDDASEVIFKEAYNIIECPEDFEDGPPPWWSKDIDFVKINEELEKEFGQEDET